MVSPELLNFVIQQLQSGAPQDAIKNTLLTNGWPEPDIEEAFVQVTSPVPPSPAKMHMSKKMIPTIVALVVVLVALGVAAISMKPRNMPVVQSPSVLPQQTPGRVLSELETLGPPPTTDASDEVRGAFSDKLRSLAKQVTSITVGPNCSFTPALISVKKDSELTIKNDDNNSEHLVSITQEYKILPGKEVSVKLATLKGGVYGISCDGLGVVGYLDLLD